VFQSISTYLKAPLRPACPHHGTMERKLAVNPAFSGLANALAGDRHYDGLRATDGADISSRTKHRNYMKSKGLTVAGDYRETWAKAQKERDALRAGTFNDKELRDILTREVMTVVAQPS
jgi:hypothetical protein